MRAVRKSVITKYLRMLHSFRISLSGRDDSVWPDLAPATASPVHNSPLQVDGSDADGIGFSALPVRKSGTPPSQKKSSKTIMPVLVKCN